MNATRLPALLAALPLALATLGSPAAAADPHPPSAPELIRCGGDANPCALEPLVVVARPVERLPVMDVRMATLTRQSSERALPCVHEPSQAVLAHR